MPENTPQENNQDTISLHKTLLMDCEISELSSPSLEILKTALQKKSLSSLDSYSGRETIGGGGTGTIISGVEESLGREVAIKILKPTLKDKRKSVERFIREARATAQIEHPNIVPVHEIGIFQDAGIYFTMKKVKGQTLREIIDNLKKQNPEYVKNYPRNRLLEIFISVCQGIAFAHSKGIIHRDLKPENVMVGDFGEVLVMDWGLVKYLHDNTPDHKDDSKENPENTTDNNLVTNLTISGSISGTPLYMAPEQALGNSAAIDRKSDLYSLGVILYSILTLAQSPFDRHKDVKEVLNSVALGDFIPPGKRAPSMKIPPELNAICLKAMAFDKENRYDDVKTLISDLRNFMQGFPVSAYKDPLFKKLWKLSLRHPVISVSTIAVIFSLIAFAAAYQINNYMKFKIILSTVQPYKEKAEKEILSAKVTFDELEKIKSQRILKEKSPREIELETKLHHSNMSIDNNYNTALILYAQVPDEYERSSAVIKAFKEIMANRINYSIKTKNFDDTYKWIDLLKLWFGNNFEEISSEETKKTILDLRKNLEKDSKLTIKVSVPNTTLSLFKITEDQNGKTSQSFIKELSSSSIKDYNISKGSYLFKVTPPDNMSSFNYPLVIEQNESIELSIYVPSKIPEGTVYIPAGRFYSGGNESRYYRLHQTFLEGFFIKKTEVTFKEYLEFWKNIKEPQKKKRYSSRVQLNMEDRNFIDAWDKNGKLISAFKPDLPVVGITQEAAAAYCEWLSRKIKMPCRLPNELEWEKAARGADGRKFVWGNDYNPDSAFIFENTEAHKKYKFFAPPGSFPEDISAFGVLDMAGNAREYTGSRFLDESPFFQVKGASASTSRRFLYCAFSSDTPVVPTDIGFRYVLPLENN